MLEADLILHVRDIAHPETEIQAEDVRAILAELGVATRRRPDDRGLEQDRPPPGRAAAPAAGRRRTPRVRAISAGTGEGVAALLAAVADAARRAGHEETLHLGFDQGRPRAWLFDQKLVRAERATDNGYDLDVRWTERERSHYQAL